MKFFVIISINIGKQEEKLAARWVYFFFLYV